MNSEILNTINGLLANPQKIVIVGHKNPDGDAVGSTIALSLFLNEKGHQAQVVLPNDFPDFLKWLPGIDDCVLYEKEKSKADALIADASIIFTLDFNSFTRVGDMEGALKNASASYVMIDHHQAPDDYAVATYSDTTMSSTCEMVYHFIDAMGDATKISEAIATLLYTGIMTDTGSFRFSSTSTTTLRVVAQLVECGAVGNRIHEQIYDTNTPDRLRLLGVALKNLTALPDYKTAYITLTQQELEDHNFQKGDTEGFVNYALSLLGTVFAVIFIENRKDNIIKMSLRSKGSFSVNEFARKYYNGGGHNNAAGGRSEKNMEDTITEFISILPDYKDQLNNA